MMFMIALDHRSNDDQVKERIEAAIKVMGNWSNRLSNVWLLETDRMGARRIRDTLKPSLNLEGGDRLLVARISRNWAGTNMGQGFPEWMKRRDFGTFQEG